MKLEQSKLCNPGLLLISCPSHKQICKDFRFLGLWCIQIPELYRKFKADMQLITDLVYRTFLLSAEVMIIKNNPKLISHP